MEGSGEQEREEATEVRSPRTEAGSYMQESQTSVQWDRGEESGGSLGSVPTEDRGTGAEATSHSLGDRTQAPSEKDSYAELPPSPLPASSLKRPVPDSAGGQGGRAYC